MENLEDLSNDQLRLKLVEYGFPNIPVTQTTRNVLLKKLRNAIENKDSVQQPKGKATTSSTRRETIHGTKVKSTDKDVDDDGKISSESSTIKNTRRTTIGMPTVKKTETSSSQPSIIPRAISTRASKDRELETKLSNLTKHITTNATEFIQYDENNKRSGNNVITRMINENDEMDVDEINNARNDPFLRKSRSPSLGKSDTITTSYKHVVSDSPIKDIIVIDESMEEDTDEVYNVNKRTYEKTNVVPPPSSSSSSKVLHHQILTDYMQPASYESDDRILFLKKRQTFESVNEPVKTDRYKQLSDKFIHEESQNYLKNRHTLGGVRDYGGSDSTRYSLSHSDYNTNKRQYDQIVDDYNEDEYADDYENEADADNSKNDGGKTKQIDFDAPYLSEFTKRLSSIKAENLGVNIRNDVKYALGSTDDYRYNRRVTNEPSIFNPLIIYFNNFFKENRLIVIGVFLLFILSFIYVFFLTN